MKLFSRAKYIEIAIFFSFCLIFLDDFIGTQIFTPIGLWAMGFLLIVFHRELAILSVIKGRTNKNISTGKHSSDINAYKSHEKSVRVLSVIGGIALIILGCAIFFIILV
jgi:hypothetical protein